jgi:hypothetical protein
MSLLRNSSAVPLLPLRGVLTCFPDPTCSSSRLARRLRDKLLSNGDPAALVMQSASALPACLSNMDPMATIASLATPVGRTPAKVTLPLLLDDRPTERNGTSEDVAALTPSEELDLEVKGMASALVLRSAASMLRGARWRAMQQRWQRSGVPLPQACRSGSESARKAPVAAVDFTGSKLTGGAFESFGVGCGVRAIGPATGADTAVAQALVQPGELRARRAGALAALLLSICDPFAVGPTGLPALGSTAAALAVRLLCTAAEAPAAGTQLTAVMRRIMLRALALLCLRQLRPAAPLLNSTSSSALGSSSLCGMQPSDRRQSLSLRSLPACELWTMPPSSPETVRPLQHLPHAIGQRLLALVTAATSSDARAEIASLLYLAAQLVAVSAPLVVQAAACSSLLPALEAVAQLLVAAGDPARWPLSLVHLMDSLLLALAGELLACT